MNTVISILFQIAFSVLGAVDVREVEYREKIIVRLERRLFHRWHHWTGFLVAMRIYYSMLQHIFNVPSAICQMRY
jgi:hypothetical protein